MSSDDDAVVAIERAMVTMRRSWSRRTLQRRAARDGAGGAEDRARKAGDEAPGPAATTTTAAAATTNPAARAAATTATTAADPGPVGFEVLDAIEAAVEGGGVMTVNGVVEALGVDQPRASRLVAGVVDAGLVRRGADPGDGRRSVLTLTARGRRVLAEGHRTRRAAVEAALAGWPAEDRETFARLLGAYVAGWERAARRGG
jgi:DNA-binding MarR family transcriptional regulator